MPLTWFIIVFVHGCASATCPNAPAPVTIAMPSQEVCQQVRDINADKAIECWAKPPK
jgi:hypothetical protein